MAYAVKKKTFIRKAVENKYLFLLILPAFAFYVIFCIVPMPGLILAFKHFYPRLGIFGSPWNGLENFQILFATPEIWQVVRNTLIISLGRILFGFTMPIVLAVLLNELTFSRYKRVVQTLLTFPHFLSWVIVAGFMRTLFSGDGTINGIITSMGGNNVAFLGNNVFFLVMLFVTDIWKEAGWSAIIYLAVMSSIDPELYEAASIDGAKRWSRIWHITLPGIKPMAVLLLLLSFGGVLSAGFDQVFNLYNPAVYEYGDILDTYLYRVVREDYNLNQGVGVAVGMIKSIISFILLFIVDRIAKAVGERGVF